MAGLSAFLFGPRVAGCSTKKVNIIESDRFLGTNREAEEHFGLKNGEFGSDHDGYICQWVHVVGSANPVVYAVKKEYTTEARDAVRRLRKQQYASEFSSIVRTEPVGEDVEGSVRHISELSYRPDGTNWGLPR
ncbi:MAG: hypothetical protein EBW87_01490 [Burkholderiaceae bacterium]|nr:hypothetical protein [Burkholderiaceae bacterium]